VRCERCGTIFCADDADTVLLGNPPKLFCSRTCKRAASQKRVKAGIYRPALPGKPGCPTPAKLAFDTKQAALSKATTVAGTFRQTAVRAYECPCGSWHLTSKRAKRMVTT